MNQNSQELSIVYQLEINENILENIPQKTKVKLFDKILLGTETNVCLQYLTIDYIGKTLLKLNNKPSAFCIYNRTLRNSIDDIPSGDCKERFYHEVTEIIKKIGIITCPNKGNCPKNCKDKFSIDKDFTQKITPTLKSGLYDKIIKYFLDMKEPCYTCHTLLYLMEYFVEHVLYEKTKQLEYYLLKTIPLIPNSYCRANIRKEINRLNNRMK